MHYPEYFMKPVKVTRPEPVFVDERGSITDLINSTEPIHHIGRLVFTPGAVRANHYHKESDQYDFILEGEIELATKSLEEGAQVHTVILKPGDLVFIPRHIIHAYRALKDSTVINVTSTSRAGMKYEEDTIRVDPLF